MAFPGDRVWKLPVTIPATSILGDPVNDLWVRITHVSLPDAMITAGGEQALQSTGTDLAASSDELGTIQIPLYVRRCDLDATPANSRVQIWVRRQDVADATDTVIWLWWGSETETAPAVDANYGRNDVFGSTTGDGAPPDGWGVWLFDEDPGDPDPAYKDHTGRGHDATVEGTVTRVDLLDVRGASVEAGVGWITTSATWAPGTGAFSLLFAGDIASEGRTCPWIYIRENISAIGYGSAYAQGPGLGTDPNTFAAVRDGDNFLLVGGTSSDNNTGWSGENISVSDLQLAHRNLDIGTSARAFIGCIDTALNAYWIRAFHDCLTGEASFFSIGEITAAAVQAVFTVSPIATGSEVRYYEQPHPQSWTIDFAGLAVADQDGTYFLFQVMGSGGASDHYAWFDLNDGSTDPAVSGRTGHEIDVATGDTDEDIAVAAATVLNAIADLTVTIVGTVVTVTGERDGELEPPADAAGATATGAGVALVVVGGTSTEEITGIEESTGTSWGGTVSVARPRTITIVIIRPGYEPIRLEGYVAQPASALVPVFQRVDLNYSNPT